MDELQAWLAQHPTVSGPPVATTQQRPSAEVWRERPDSCSCHCCDGTGLVSVDVVQRFVNPEYDAVMSPPVRCLRSPICGREVRQWNDPEVGPREQTSRRYESRPELPELPSAIAERIHQALKAERRAMARDPERGLRVEALRQQSRQLVAALLGSSDAS